MDMIWVGSGRVGSGVDKMCVDDRMTSRPVARRVRVCVCMYTRVDGCFVCRVWVRGDGMRVERHMADV